MIIVEVCIVLVLIVGLFIWLLSVVIIGLIIVFCLFGMFYWVNIWFIFVVFVLMNGLGCVVGLDCWVILWI